MTSIRLVACAGLACAVLVMAPRSAVGQGRSSGLATTAQLDQVRSSLGSLVGAVVTGAPFSADASTVVVQTLGDGTRIEQRSSTKFYRDGAGRVRREQEIIGLDTLNPSSPSRTAISFDTVPNDPMPYVLDPVARTARRMPRPLAMAGMPGTTTTFRARSTGDRAAELVDAIVNAQGTIGPRRGVPNDIRPVEEDLGTRQVEGVKATGRRTTTTIPQGRIGNDRPIQIIDERWESPELGVIVSSRYSDPRTGVVEYSLTNVTRGEPRADLFQVPPDYTVTPVVTPGRNGAGPSWATPGARGGRSAQPQP
jgi:hypothetical protein